MRFCIVDLSGTKTDGELIAYAAAQQAQLREDYAAAYDGDGDDDEVRIATAAAPPAADELPILLHPVAPTSADGSDGGILGEHGLTAIDVYLDLVAKYAETWTTTASHEVLEARRDRRLHACIELDDGTIIDCEIADRVEAESYTKLGVAVSNFNTPQCFEPTGAPGEKFDHMGTSTKSNEVRPGGYAQHMTPGGTWVQDGAMRGYRAEIAERGLSRNAKKSARRAAAWILAQAKP